MKLIVGLGNPGPEYKGTRHNIGFMAVEEIAAQLRVQKEESRCQAIIATARHQGSSLLLAKPMTYMNLSGQAVRRILAVKKITLPDFIVVFDDMDLELGRLRFRSSGGSGGHKGLQSIINELGTEEFARLRIGIGRPQGHHVIDHVLNGFEKDEEEIVKGSIKKSSEALLYWFSQGIVKAMNQYN